MIPIIVFLISSCLVYFSYTHTQNYLTYNTINFSKLTTNKQYYVVKNITKGFYLFFLVVSSGLILIPDIYNDIWDNDIIRIFASMYVSNDVVGLYRVSRLPTSTRLHHTASFIFMIVAWNVDFQSSNVGQLLLLYTYFSAISFPVNLYLGMRLCYDDMLWLKNCSKYVYFMSCMLNWWLQYRWVVYDNDTLLYMCFMSVIVLDDVILLKWLWK